MRRRGGPERACMEGWSGPKALRRSSTPLTEHPARYGARKSGGRDQGGTMDQSCRRL
jgi:hypothetical protein